MPRIIRTETRKRGFLGKIAKWTFVIFNVVMLVWLIAYWGQLAEMSEGVRSEAEVAGAVIGGTLGTGMLVFFWGAGAVILGLFALLTKGKKIIVETTE